MASKKKKQMEQPALVGPAAIVSPITPIRAPSTDVPTSGTGDAANADEAHHLLYKGASGQMAVMSEFLYRLLNVAVLEVDVGDDVFVVREKDEAVTRVQVKYSRADSQQNDSYVTQFFLPWEQFDRLDDTPALVYVLAVRYKEHWTDFIVIRRSVLRQLQADHAVGSIAKNNDGDPLGLKLRLVFTIGDVKAKGDFSLQPYRNAFEPWPPAQL